MRSVETGRRLDGLDLGHVLLAKGEIDAAARMYTAMPGQAIRFRLASLACLRKV